MTEKGSKLLVVNHDSKVRALLRRHLEDSGYMQVTEAVSGLAAVKILQSHPMDIVITDIAIGELDGWRLTRLIRAGLYKCQKSIPIIVLTRNWCQRIAEITGREFGINKLVPVDQLEQIPDCLNTCINLSEDKYSAPRVLVIEDNSDTTNLVQRMLRHRFEVETAADGLSGLEAWKNSRHDLVLLDVMLPKMAGPDVLREILEIREDQPVVVMTAYSSMELAQQLMLKGAVDFVAKPFRAEQLRKVCDLAIRREDYLVSHEQFSASLESLRESTDAYRKVSEDYRRLLSAVSTTVFELDHTGRLRFLSEAWTRLTGLSINESVGRHLSDYLAFEERKPSSAFSAQLSALLSGTLDRCQFELRLFTRLSKPIWVECRLDAMRTDDGTAFIFGCLDDISERKKAQQELEFHAVHDSLTGLFNRYYFDSVLQQMAAAGARNKSSHALLYIDLDHFKVINDTFGHHHGDVVLRDISSLLGARLRKSDILCRIGGDEFAVLLADTELEQAQVIAQEICDLIREFQYLQSGRHFEVSCSIGICEVDGQADSTSTYMRKADVALYVAKRRGRNLVHVYDPNDKEGEELRISIDWARRFRKAIGEEHVLLHFQPILHIRTNQVAHYEALVRLDLPEEGLISPGVFIPALEQAGEMAMLDHWVIRQVAELLSQHPFLHRVAVNLSAQAFRDERLVALVQEELTRHKINPGRIIFELTESASLANVTATQRMINSLHDLGCSFALDDFGTGFSTFSYLKQFPVDSVKVDGSFIAQLDKKPEDQAIVRAICQVAGALGKKTVAEFVENAAVLDILRDIGVDYAQGFHIGRPVHINQLGQRQIPGRPNTARAGSA